MSGDRGSATPFQESVVRLSAHARRHPNDAVIALVGPATWAPQDVAAAMAGALGAGSPHIRRAETHKVGHGTSARRLDVLDEAAAATDAAALLSCTRATEPDDGRSRLLFVELVDWLDEDSLRVIDEVVRRGRTSVMLSSVAHPQRFTEALNSPRGMVADNGPLTREDAVEIIRSVTGATPTARSLDYLVHFAGGARGWLRWVAELGVLEEWLVAVDGVAVIARTPMLMQARWAEQVVSALRGIVSIDTLRMLERVAMSGAAPIGALMSDAASTRAVVLLERAGVLRISEGRCLLAVPAMREALVAASTHESDVRELWEAAVANGDEERSAFMAFRSGVALSDEELVRGAYAALERGSFAQAFALLNEADGMGEGPRYAQAVLQSLSGRPWHAIAALRRDQEAESADARTAMMAEVYIRYIQETSFPFAAVGMREQSPIAKRSDLPPVIGDYAVAVEQMRAYNAMFRLVEVDRPASVASSAAGTDLDWRARAGTGASHEPGDAAVLPTAAVGGTRNASELAQVVALVTQACEAAINGRAEAAAELVDRLTGRDWPCLPSLGGTWCIERLGFARLLTRFDAEPVPARVTGTPERGFMRAVPIGVLEVLGAVMRGETQDELQWRMRQLWAEHSTSLPHGTVSRSTVDALDGLVAGIDSRRPYSAAESEFASGVHVIDPLARFAGEMSRLLRCPAGELADDDLLQSLALQSVTEGTVGVPRALIRTLVLRRAGTLPAETCAMLLAPSIAAGVEPEFRALLRARAASDKRAWAAARAEIEALHPRVSIAEHLDGLDADDSPTRLHSAHLEVLTKREAVVVQRLIDGESTAEIAEALGIAPRTAETHVRNAYRKLGVHSRTQLRAEVVR